MDATNPIGFMLSHPILILSWIYVMLMGFKTWWLYYPPAFEGWRCVPALFGVVGQFPEGPDPLVTTNCLE